MNEFDESYRRAGDWLRRVSDLNARYRAGRIHVHVPPALLDGERPLDALVATHFPASQKAFDAAMQGLFFSLPVAFEPAASVGPYLAVTDTDADGEPYRFLDMGAQIATQVFGENDPAIVRNVLEALPFVASRYAHSEYQTVLSLRFKAALARVAPAGTPRFFVVNTGAEAVENAIKTALMNRVMTSAAPDGGFIVSFEGAFHGRTLGALAVTHRKKARLGFPTFDWPHIAFPSDDPRAPKDTLRREDRSLKQLWDLLVSGRLPHADKSKETYRREMAALDQFLEPPDAGSQPTVDEFIQAQRALLSADVLQRARRVAAVLVEPIQGEGGIRQTTARFMRKLRLLTRIYDVPLIFDEVQTGWGMTGRMWAHELFDLPCPPDIVTWAKKAQNGVLFVSESLATFFQEEKKFNTTWEGDSVGMARIVSLLDTLDLDLARRTGERSRLGLEALARDYPELLAHVRGAGVMLGFDVLRADLRDVLLDRTFRRGLLLLPAGERTLRFYPRFDTEPSALDEALAILRAAVEDVGGVASGTLAATAPPVKTRAGTLAIPLETVEVVDLTPAGFEASKALVMTIERERYAPPLQYPIETLETTMANPRAIGLALRDRVSGRLLSYALGSALENHDEEGVASDPHFGDANTFYLQATATLPSLQNTSELENLVLDTVRARAAAAGFEYVSMLIEDAVRSSGPDWLRDATEVRHLDNYLRSGVPFAYVQAALNEPARTPPPPPASPST